MTLEFKTRKGISQLPLIERLIKELISHNNLVEYVGRIFSVYATNSNKEFSLDEVSRQIHTIFKNPRLKLSPEKIEELVNLLLEFYELPPEPFQKRRGEVLERIIYTFGPFSPEVGLGDVRCYLEPQILDEGMEISSFQNKCDLVFHTSDNKPVEFIECKANISNIIPYCFEKMKKTHMDKILYLSDCYVYLTEKYSKPKILFACYNVNYEKEKKGLEENGYQYMDIISTREIMNRRASCVQ
ncbi:MULTISPECIES: hypothetical protein [Bacillus cereus group]|uniref:hypothetical protein n=1 Tax=Bacillus cereus group TaxID=86661 RepID=UPI00350E46D2